MVAQFGTGLFCNNGERACADAADAGLFRTLLAHWMCVD